VKALRLSAALAVLTLTASTTCAAVIDLSTTLGPSGHYTTQAYYQGMLGGQPMTAAQQAYADRRGRKEDHRFLRRVADGVGGPLLSSVQRPSKSLRQSPQVCPRHIVGMS